MAADPPREQEQSIKDRKRLLYDDDDAPVSALAVERKPFSVYLRETPARPLSGGVKAALWAAAIIAALLLAGAVMKSTQGKPPSKKRAELMPVRSSVIRLA